MFGSPLNWSNSGKIGHLNKNKRVEMVIIVIIAIVDVLILGLFWLSRVFKMYYFKGWIFLPVELFYLFLSHEALIDKCEFVSSFVNISCQ